MSTIQEVIDYLNTMDDGQEVAILAPKPETIDTAIGEQDFNVTVADLKKAISQPIAVGGITHTTKVISGTYGANIRADGNINGKLLGEIAPNTQFDVLDETTDSYRRISGWVAKSVITEIGNEPIEHMFVTNRLGVYARSDHDTKSIVQHEFAYGDPIDIQGSYPDISGTTYIFGKVVGQNWYVARQLLGTIQPPPLLSRPLSKLGMHLYPDVGVEVLDFLRDMYNQGTPVAGVLLLKPSNITIQQIKQASPSTLVCARPYVHDDGTDNPGNWVGMTRQNGLDWFNGRTMPIIRADWGDLQHADLIQPTINEPGYDLKGTPRFWNGMLDGAIANNIPLGLLCFGMGTPPLEMWDDPEWVDLCTRAANTVLPNGKLIRLLMHQYAPIVPRPRLWTDIWTAQRHKLVMAKNLAYKRVHWFFGEYGDEKMPEQGADFFIQQWSSADNLLMQDDNIDAACLWTFINNGYPVSRNWGGDNLNVFLPNLRVYLTSKKKS